MSDPEQREPEPKEQEPEKREPTVKEQIDSAMAVYKGEIAGLNKRNSELEKELKRAAKDKEDLAKAHMSDKERHEFDNQKREEDMARREAVVEEQQREAMINLALSANGVDASAKELMQTPKTPEEADAWTALFQEAVKAGVEKGVNVALAKGNGAPKSGAGSGVTAKLLDSFEDGKNASPEAFQQYLEATINS